MLLCTVNEVESMLPRKMQFEFVGLVGYITHSLGCI